MAFEQVLGVLEVRKIKTIHLFNRTMEKAVHFRQRLLDFGVEAEIMVADQVTKVVETADIVCCSTRSNDPVFDGNDLQDGTHINGVGSYLPTMREVDLLTIKKSGKIVVDDVQSAKEEAKQPILTLLWQKVFIRKQNSWDWVMILKFDLKKGAGRDIEKIRVFIE